MAADALASLVAACMAAVRGATSPLGSDAVYALRPFAPVAVALVAIVASIYLIDTAAKFVRITWWLVRGAGIAAAGAYTAVLFGRALHRVTGVGVGFPGAGADGTMAAAVADRMGAACAALEGAVGRLFEP